DRLWRRRAGSLLGPRPGERVLDLAAGTAVSTVELGRSGAWCVAADFSLGMLRAGAGRDVPQVAGDAMALPFADASFDAATISFGLRNVQDTGAGLREMARVVKPGGRLAVVEFSTPVLPPFRALYMNYLMRALPRLATSESSNPDAYVYLAESIRDWPDQRARRELGEANGWERCSGTDLAGGIAAIHLARRAAWAVPPAGRGRCGPPPAQWSKRG